MQDLPTARGPRPAPRAAPQPAPRSSRGEAARLRRVVERDMASLRPGEPRGWWLREALAADPGEPCPPPARDATADVVIVGGGFTGLWTAWWLTEHAPGHAGRPARGGHRGRRRLRPERRVRDRLVGPPAHPGRALRPEGGLAIADALAEAPAAIGEWTRAHGVDAWFTPGGSILAASSPAQEGGWSAIVAAPRRWVTDAVPRSSRRPRSAPPVPRRCSAAGCSPRPTPPSSRPAWPAGSVASCWSAASSSTRGRASSACAARVTACA